MNKKMNQSHYIVKYDVIEDIGYLMLENGTYNVIESAEFLDIDYLKQWIESNKLKGLIITGSGRHFSSGANREQITNNKNDCEKIVETLNKGKQILNYIEKLPIITVAAIRGACFGAGFEIALACQYRICTQNALLAFPETSIGLIPGMGGNSRLCNLIGKKLAIKYILTANKINADEALEMRIVDKVVAKDKLLIEAANLIKEITGKVSKEQATYIFDLMNSMTFEGNEEINNKESIYFAELANKFE